MLSQKWQGFCTRHQTEAGTLNKELEGWDMGGRPGLLFVDDDVAEKI